MLREHTNWIIITVIIIIVIIGIVIYGFLVNREHWLEDEYSEHWPSNSSEQYNGNTGSWSDKLIREELSESDLQRHYNDMVRQAPIFSSGAGYSVVAEDNTSPAFTDYVGLFPPSYVPILPDQRQVTDLDVKQMLTRKRVKW